MATYIVLTGTRGNGDCITYLVGAEVAKEANEQGETLADYIKRPGETLAEKGKVEIVGAATDYLPDTLIEA